MGNVEQAVTEADIIEHVLGATPLPLVVSGWGMLDLDITITAGLAGATRSEVQIRPLTTRPARRARRQSPK